MTPRERAWSSVRGLLDRSDHEIVGRVEAAILADRAEQAAGEAERVREAAARAYEDAAAMVDERVDSQDDLCPFRQLARDIRARATSPAPVAEPAPCVCGCPASEHDARNIVGEIERDCAAHGCERYYDSTCTLGVPGGVDPEPALAAHPADRAATDAAKSARARGEDVYADGEGRAVIEAAEARMREAVDALAAARKGG